MAAPPKAQSNMARQHRLIIIVLTASCWMFLLAIVLSSIFGASKQAKPIPASTIDHQPARAFFDAKLAPESYVFLPAYVWHEQWLQ
jgi:hypothetical protein